MSEKKIKDIVKDIITYYIILVLLMLFFKHLGVELKNNIFLYALEITTGWSIVYIIVILFKKYKK